MQCLGSAAAESASCPFSMSDACRARGKGGQGVGAENKAAGMSDVGCCTPPQGWTHGPGKHSSYAAVKRTNRCLRTADHPPPAQHHRTNRTTTNTARMCQLAGWLAGLLTETVALPLHDPAPH